MPVADRKDHEQEVVKLASRLGTPAQDGDTLEFLYEGAADKVEAVGAFVPPLELKRVEGTDLWVARKGIPNVDLATVGYFLSVDGKAQRDPYSKLAPDPTEPHQVTWHGAKVGPHPELKPDPKVAHGRTEHFSINSANLGESRSVTVYLPPGFDPMQRYPVLYAPDESIVVGRMRVTDILDNLIAAKRLRPLVGVFIESRNDARAREYLPEGDRWQAYQRFFLQELMPRVEGRYSVRSDRSARVLWGVSNGAAWAALTALQWPALFQGAIVESPAFAQQETIPAQAVDRPQRFYLIGGTLEEALAGPFGYLAQGLKQGGYELRGVQRPAGHEPVFWAEELPAALAWFFPGSAR